MSDFDLPEPAESSKLPEGLEPNASDLTGEKKSKKWIWIVVIALVLLLCCCCAVGGYVMFQNMEGMDFNSIMNEYSMLVP